MAKDSMGELNRRELLKKGAQASAATVVASTAFSGTSLAGCTGKHTCARTPGFWKNHTEMWHGNHLHFSTARDDTDLHRYFRDYDGRSSVLSILESKPRGDKSLIMATHFSATLLNIKAGTDGSGIGPTLWDARKWFDDHPVGSNQRKWDGGEEIKDTLDAYNNGNLDVCSGD